MHRNVCLIMLMMIIYLTCPCILCWLARDIYNCESHNYRPYHYWRNVTEPISEQIELEKLVATPFCAGDYHSVRAILITTWAGLALLPFRVFLGKVTRAIKYSHAIMHLITLLLFAYDYYKLYIIERSISHSYNNVHGLGGKLVLGVLVIQFCMSFIIYIYMFDNCALRCAYATIHQIVGITVYISLAGLIINGFIRVRLDFLNPTITLHAMFLVFISYPLILSIVINPYFEWEMVGSF